MGVGMMRIQIVIGTIYPKCLEGADVLFRLNQVVEIKRARPRHVKSVVKLPSLYERVQEDVARARTYLAEELRSGGLRFERQLYPSAR